MEFRLGSITSKGFMKLPDGEYNLRGSVGFIKGRNAQGKSSLLALIGYVLGTKVGAGIQDPINKSEDEARVVIEFTAGDGLDYKMVAEWKRSDGSIKTKLYVLTPDQVKITKVSDIKRLLGNPPEIVDIMQIAKEQSSKGGQLRNLKNIFQPLLGVDVTDMHEDLVRVKGIVSEHKKEIKSIEGMFSTNKLQPEDTLNIPEPVNVGDLQISLEEEEKKHRHYAAAVEFLGEADESKNGLLKKKADAEKQVTDSVKFQKESIEAKIKELQEKLKNVSPEEHLVEKVNSIQLDIDELDRRAARAEVIVEAGDGDPESIREKLNDAGATNTRIESLNNMKGHATKLFELRKDVLSKEEEAATIMANINEVVSAAADDADIPDRFVFQVDDEDGAVKIMYRDQDTGDLVPFDENQVAQSQMILGSLALTMAAFAKSGAKTRFITIKDAMLLDKSSMEAAIRMAETYGFSVYPELVTETDGVIVELFDSYEDAIRRN